MSDPKPRVALSLALLAALVTFAPAARFDFVDWDDGNHVLENPAVQTPGRASARDVWLTPGLGYPTPLPVLTYRIEHAIVGNSPALYHTTNVVLHLVAVALVFALARRARIGVAGAALAAVLFGVHPVVAETVSWVSGRKDLLVTVLALTSVLVAARSETPNRVEKLGAFGAFVLALACKPVAAFVLVAIPVFRWAVHASRARTSVALIAPMAVVLVAYLPVAVKGQSAVHAIVPWAGVGTYLRSMVWSLGMHVDLLLLVQEPSAKYMPPSLVPPFTPIVDLAPLVFVGVLAAMATALDAPRRRVFLAACVSAAAAYAPNSNLIPLTRFVADTYVYIPLTFLAVAIGVAFDRFLERVGERARLYARAVPVASAIVLAMLALPASARYRNSLTLWAQAFQANPHDSRLCQNWEESVRTLRGPAEGLAAIERCIATFGPRGFHKNRGMALVQLGREREALAEFEIVQRAYPEDRAVAALIAEIRARGITPLSPGTP